MPVETAQMLCTVIWMTGGEAKYKPCYQNHPCVKWLLESIDNYMWLCELGLSLCKEYTFRYGKQHACEKVIESCYIDLPFIESIGITKHALAMPDDCRISDDAVECYRLYYKKHKSHLHKWKNREVPFFLND
jgi:hypothetical protein